MRREILTTISPEELREIAGTWETGLV